MSASFVIAAIFFNVTASSVTTINETCISLLDNLSPPSKAFIKFDVDVEDEARAVEVILLFPSTTWTSDKFSTSVKSLNFKFLVPFFTSDNFFDLLSWEIAQRLL